MLKGGKGNEKLLKLYQKTNNEVYLSLYENGFAFVGKALKEEIKDIAYFEADIKLIDTEV